ncbi:MAG: hypothetical protein IJ793_00125 [Opitutales bacterium]|nr:hypothetical protein [Opitutales bacterium]
MNEELSIGTDTVGETDVLSVSATDADENVVVDVKHLTVDPENVTRFREQLHSKSQSKETKNISTVEGETKREISESLVLKHSRKDFYEKSMEFDVTKSISTAEGETKRNASEKPVSKHSAPNERTLFGNNGRNTPPFVAGKAHPCPSKNQSIDNFRKDFYEKPMEFDVNFQSSAPKASSGTMARTSGISDAASTSIHTRNLRAVTKELSSGIPSAETFHAPENRTAPHPYGGNDTVSANASATKPTGTKQQNVPETSKPLSKTDNTASTAEPLSKIKTREHPHSPESASDMHKTAVWETIPFLRTTVETTAPVQEPTATQASKSQAMLIAQQIRDHIIDRILVSSSALNTQHTVTVRLSPRLLRDTEVQFTQNGTSLDIQLVSQNKDSVQFLQQYQSDLQTYLQGELKTYRAISVRVPSSQASAELAQPHDGRSRNRFDYQSADEEETT